MKCLLILNGKKAGDQAIRDAVTTLRGKDVDLSVRVTWEHGDALRFVQEAVHLGCDRVIAGGGDGSVNEVSAALMTLSAEERPVLAILPLGTANDFASACGIPIESQAALRLAVEGSHHRVDLGQVNDRYFINVASAGFGAEVTAQTPPELKNFLGGGAYTLMGVVRVVNFEPYRFELALPETTLHEEALIGAVCNGRQAGGGQVLGPLATIDDGLLDVVVILRFPVNAANQVLAEFREPATDGEFVRRFRTPWVKARCDKAIPMNLDGEPYNARDLHVEIVPGAISLVLPTTCPMLAGSST